MSLAIAALIRAGVNPELIAMVADELAEARSQTSAMGASLAIVRAQGAARQASFRNRHGPPSRDNNVISNVTSNVTGGAKSLAPHARVLPCEESKNITPTPSELSPSAETASRKRAATGGRGDRLPLDWLPSEDLGRPDLAKRELPKFLDHWRAQPGARGVKLDWDATWRNWLRRSVEGDARSTGPPYAQRPTNGFVQMLQELDANERSDPH